MRRALIPAFLLLLGGAVLGATVFHEPLASAASSIPSVIVSNSKTSPVPVAETNVDAGGNIKVHEQGTVPTRPSIPATAFSVGTPLQGETIAGPAPAGIHYAITSITVSNSADVRETGSVQVVDGPTADCSQMPNLGPTGPTVLVPPGDTRTVSFPQPFVIATTGSDYVCLRSRLSSADGNVELTVVGYSF